MGHEAIHELFHRAAVKFPDNTAIVGAGQSVSYKELEESSNNVANFLIQSGIRKGSVVAILAENPSQSIRAILAILKSGCAFVPLDPEMPEKRLELMLAEVEPECFITDAKFFGRICSLAGSMNQGARVLCLDAQERADHLPEGVNVLEGFGDYWNPDKPAVEWQPDDMCYLYFTSGSTGKPKGIAGRLKGVDHFIRWEIATLHVTDKSRVSLLLPLTFDGSLRDMFVPLCAGGTVCIPAGREAILDARNLARWIDEQRIEIIHCVPSLFRSLINEDLKPTMFASLKAVLLAGEPLLPSDVGKWVDVFGERVQLLNLYGTSETTMAKFIYFVKPSDRDRPSIPVGKPMPGARAMILDEKGDPCPTGVVGEIYIRTPYRSLGYYKQPELTREVFLPNPFGSDPDDIVYKTGDLGRVLEDGNYEYLGRKDQQVKVRGVRVELGEIENILRKHESVRDQVVVDRQDGNAMKYLCAYVVLADEIDPSQLRDYLSLYLPAHMVPSVFITMKKLPRSLNGKVDRKALPNPSEAQAATNSNYIAPRTPVEEMLAAIWMQVLGVSRVGVRDSFFQLGGHSLLATRIISRVRATFNIELPLPVLFEKPTLAAQAESIEAAMKAGAGIAMTGIERIARDGELPLSFAQQRLWILHQLDRESSHYNMPTAVRLRGLLNVTALEQTITEVVRRHESLRTVFPSVDNHPVQVISPPSPVRLSILDLTRLPDPQREAEARRLIGVEFKRPFDLARGPLVRTTLIRLDGQDHIALFTMHHIVSDGWSMGIIVQEVAELYRSYVTGGQAQLVELPIQYADYAHWQRRHMQGETLASQVSYWKQRLSGLSTLRLPTDHARPSAALHKGGHKPLSLPKDLLADLKELSQKEGCTLFITLAAAFQSLLRWYSGQDDVVIGTDIANRNLSEIEGLVGFFVNQLVLRTDLSGNPSFKELLRREREVVLGAYAHQDLPFDKLVEVLNPDRGGSRSPLFQVKLVLQNTPQEALELPGLTLSGMGVGHGAAKYDLMLTLLEGSEGLVGVFEYSADLFESETISHMADQFELTLRHVAARPDAKLNELTEALDAADRQHLAEKERQLRELSLQRFNSLRQRRADVQQMGGNEIL